MRALSSDLIGSDKQSKKMADDRGATLLQEAFDQIACLTGVNLSDNRQMNASSNTPVSNSVSMELSRRFPLLRMPADSTPQSSVTPATPRATSSTTSINSSNRARSCHSSSTRSQPSRKRKRTVDTPAKVIYKDLVFIPDPEEQQVPTHNARVTLETEGKIIHGFPVNTEWDARSLRRKICDQIPELLFSEFEYVKVINLTVVPPPLL